MPLTLEQKKLYKSIHNILWDDWDPIGLNDSAAKDEYQTYTPQIFTLTINNADLETIAQHLFQVEQERMGLDGSLERCRKVAGKIIDAKA